MDLYLTWWQAFLLPVSAACFAGGVVCLAVAIGAALWEVYERLRFTAYQRALRRYYSAQESLRAAETGIRVVWWQS